MDFELDEIELYTFHDYCVDKGIVKPNHAIKLVPSLWDLHGDDYIQYCKDNELDYEDLNSMFK